eukprot:148879-Chlamydomonas_euryale.AAC.1
MLTCRCEHVPGGVTFFEKRPQLPVGRHCAGCRHAIPAAHSMSRQCSAAYWMLMRLCGRMPGSTSADFCRARPESPGSPAPGT